ncbi:MAG: hypothetical protein ACREBU_15460 [Nitrososphaera sp.]
MIPRGLMVAFSVLTLSSCTTVGQYQGECEKRYSALTEMVSCLKARIAEDPRMGRHSSSDLLRLYLAYADAAVSRVQEGTMSETDARLALAELYSRLKTTEHTRAANEAAAYGAFLQGLGTYQQSTRPSYVNPRTPITCYRSGNYINCW